PRHTVDGCLAGAAGPFDCEERRDEQALGPVEQACRHAMVLRNRKPFQVGMRRVADIRLRVVAKALERLALLVDVVLERAGLIDTLAFASCRGSQLVGRRGLTAKDPVRLLAPERVDQSRE